MITLLWSFIVEPNVRHVVYVSVKKIMKNIDSTWTGIFELTEKKKKSWLLIEIGSSRRT